MCVRALRGAPNLRCGFANGWQNINIRSRRQTCRKLHIDGRNRLSSFWAPTMPVDPTSSAEDGSSSLLIKAGFMRQSHSGIFHMLPLGLRVQNKLEGLIDRHMQGIGASKLSLSSITSQELWKRTGRYAEGTEFLSVKDRKGSGFLLSPTHEEEITNVAAGIIRSYKDLPLRLYQISRKYRDELRPRQGLLRAKEFLMKDLYTFDYDQEHALSTYSDVRKAYAAIFNELRIPYMVAKADSGNMGGSLSHEYHYPSPKGEDIVFACNKCNYVANEEVATSKYDSQKRYDDPSLDIGVWTGISEDRLTLIRAILPKNWSSSGTSDSSKDPQDLIDVRKLKSICPTLDTSVHENALELWLAATQAQSEPTPRQVLQYVDPRCPLTRIATMKSGFLSTSTSSDDKNTTSVPTITETKVLADTLTRITPGSPCPSCSSGILDSERCIEVGHTFHLGTRYSEPLRLTVQIPPLGTQPSHMAPLQMGCHGIGVSRLISATSSILSSPTALGWPVTIAPFEAIVIQGRNVSPTDAEGVYDSLAQAGVDTMLSDVRDTVWNLKDADVIGYPVIVVLGKEWKDGKVEVQCRLLEEGGLTQMVDAADVGTFVNGLLTRLRQ